MHPADPYLPGLSDPSSPTGILSDNTQTDRRTDPSAWLEAPPGFEIVGLLGQGGMGRVYKAWQATLKRHVALKVLSPLAASSPECTARLRAEAEAVAAFNHPNIIRIHEMGEWAGSPYLVLEFVDGPNLSQLVAGTPQDPREAAALVEVLARAMHVAHSRAIIHRDLKPSNILMDPHPHDGFLTVAAPCSQAAATARGPDPRDWGQGAGHARRKRPAVATLRLTEEFSPKITDFGLAKDLLREGQLTATGFMIGTPSYMAPEQSHGSELGIGPTADVYALGAILYELLTGQPPLTALAPLLTIERVRGDEPLPPSRLQPGLAAGLDVICLKCLRKEPENRYATALDLADDLGRFLRGEPLRARPESYVRRSIRWGRRKPLLACLSVSLALSIVGAFLAVGLAWRMAEANRRLADGKARAAEQERQRAERNFHKARQAVAGFFVEQATNNVALAQGNHQILRRQLLSNGRAFYIDFLEQRKDDPSLRDELARTLGWLARIDKEIGTRADAIRHYEMALAIYRELIAHNPNETRYRRNIATCLDNLGLLYGQLGRSPLAIWHLVQGLKEREDLALTFPNEKRNLHAPLGSMNNLAITLRDAGKSKEARAMLQRACLIGERQARESPKDLSLQFNLARFYHNRGLAELDIGEQAAARKSFAKGIELVERVIPQVQGDAEVHKLLGSAYQELGRVADNRNAEPIWLDLIPGLGSFLKSLLPFRGGDRALPHYEKAAQAFATALRLQPDWLQSQKDIAEVRGNIGLQRLKEGAWAEARADFESARAAFQRLRDAHPDVTDHTAHLALHEKHLGILDVLIGEPYEALARFDAAEALWRELEAAGPLEPDNNQERAHLQFRRADVLDEIGDVDSAARTYEEALQRQRQIVKSNPQVLRYRRYLDSRLALRAESLLEEGDAREALALTLERRDYWTDSPVDRVKVALALWKCGPNLAPDQRRACYDASRRALWEAMGMRAGDRSPVRD